MARQKGYVTPPEERLRISRSRSRTWYFQNAVKEAGEAVLAAAAEGNPRKVNAVAQERLRAVREQFGDHPLIFRILPPVGEEDETGPGGEA